MTTEQALVIALARAEMENEALRKMLADQAAEIDAVKKQVEALKKELPVEVPR